MWLLVTGCGRCGTGFMAQLLSGLKVGCTHEGVFNSHGWDWALECIQQRRANPHWMWHADSSWLATPYLLRPELDVLTVVQVVREPTPTIESMLRMRFAWEDGHSYFRWMADNHLPELWEMETAEERAAYWYVRLNELCEARADYRHRVEGDVRPLLSWLGVEWEGKQLYNNTLYNHLDGYGSVTFDPAVLPESLYLRLRAMSLKYGYGWAYD